MWEKHLSVHTNKPIVNFGNTTSTLLNFKFSFVVGKKKSLAASSLFSPTYVEPTEIENPQTSYVCNHYFFLSPGQ